MTIRTGKGELWSRLPGRINVRLKKGRTIGGVLVDKAGNPVPGARIGMSVSNMDGLSGMSDTVELQEYSRVWLIGDDRPVTDAQGRWSYDAFPVDCHQIHITVETSDGAQTKFSTLSPKISGVKPERVLKMSNLLRKRADMTLDGTQTVVVRVVDEDGKDIPGARVKPQALPLPDGLLADERGRFTVPRLSKPFMWITGLAEGYASASARVEFPRDNEDELILTLTKPGPLFGKIVDRQGLPIADAELQYWGEAVWGEGYKHAVHWNGKTDENGAFSWREAPIGPGCFYVRSPYLSGRAVRVQRKSERATMIVEGSAADAETGEAISDFEVVPRYQYFRRDGKLEEDEIVSGKAGRFRVTFYHDQFPDAGVMPYCRLEIRAKGYAPLLSEPFAYDNSDDGPPRSFKLQRGAESVRGVILTPDGAFAEGAGAMARINVGDHRRPHFTRYFPLKESEHVKLASRRVTSNADGRFKFKPDARADHLYVSHESGFAEMEIDGLTKPLEIRLKKWGRIEVNLGIAPAMDEIIRVKEQAWRTHARFETHLEVRPKSSGAYVFEHVPPGRYQVARHIHRSQVESHRVPITLDPGETETVSLAAEGGDVTGRIVLKSPKTVDFWLNQNHQLSHLMELAVDKPREPSRNDFVDVRLWAPAYRAYHDSEEYRRYNLERREYPLEFYAGGAFRVRRVPPGEYILKFRLIDRRNSRGFFPTGDRDAMPMLASIRKRVIVPEGDAPLDLGELKAVEEGEAEIEPVASVAQSLTQTDVFLRRLNGESLAWTSLLKNVDCAIFHFWKATEPGSTNEFATLKTIHEEWGDDPRFAIVGISLDSAEDEGKAKAIVENLSPPWPNIRDPEFDQADKWAKDGLPVSQLINYRKMRQTGKGEKPRTDLTGDALIKAVGELMRE